MSLSGVVRRGISLSERASSGRRALWAARDYGIVVAFVGLFVTLTLASDPFFTRTNLLNVLDQVAPAGIVACAATIVIIAGGFDLSVGAIFALAGSSAALIAEHGYPTLGLLCGALAGLAVGICNGGVITLFRVNPFVATLASQLMIRGVAVLLTSGLLITVTATSFTTLGQGSVLSVKYSVVTFVVFAAVCWFLLDATTFGRRIFAVGANAEAARVSGVNVKLVQTATFALSGLSAGIAGVIAASRISTGQADVGIGLELTAIAAVVIGGTSILGGEGAIWRTVLGVLFLQMIQNGFNLLGVEPYYQSIVQGAIIVTAVAIDALARRS
jgi:ribose transport system permease protein